ncbi:MAG: FHA domain-containing protein [Nitrosomonadales bacterium]|nr:FHA domain-containing protein [Nitrosomonadales bacterium]
MAAKLILSMDGAVLKEYTLNKERMTIGRKPHNDIVIDNLAVSGEHAAILTILNDSFLEDLDSTNGVMVNGAQIKKHFLQNNDVVEIGKYKLKYMNDQQGQAADTEFEKTMVLRAPVKTQQAAAPQTKAPGTDAAMKTHSSLAPSLQTYEKTGKFETAMPQAPVARPAPAAPPAPAGTPAVSPAPAPAQVAPAASAAPAAPATPAQPAAVTLAAVQILSGPNIGKELDLVKNLTTLGKPGVQVAVLTRRPHGYFITHVEGASYPVLNGKTLDEHPHQLNDHDIIELAGIKMEFYFKA